MEASSQTACDCASEGAGACPIMCTSPTVLPTIRLEHVQSKSSAQRLSEGKKLPILEIQSRQKGRAEANKRMGISEKVMAEVNQARTSNQSKTLFRWLTKGNSLKNSSTYGIRTIESALELVKSAQVMAARIALWVRTARVAAATAAMMGATLAVTISAVVVGLVFGVRWAVAKMEVGIVLWIRMTAALEVVAVASSIPGTLATVAIAVVRVGQVLLPLLLLITTLLR